MEDFVRLWPLVLSFIFLVAWSIRLESKVTYLEKDHYKFQERESMTWAKIDTIQTTTNSILQSLAKIEGKLEAKEHH